MIKQSDKLGLLSVIFLGVNAIVGSGIFLLPNKAYALVGSMSLLAVVLNAILASSIAFCFAEAASWHSSKNGGPYIYSKEAFGEFIGFEVGFMKYIISATAWAAMANALITILSVLIPPLQNPMISKMAIAGLIIFLTALNLNGIKTVKIINNIVSASKLIPMILFVAVGIFFLKGENFVITPVLEGTGTVAGNFGVAMILIFYSYTGFESIAMGAEDMKNPKKDIPRAIIICIVLVSILYTLIVGICIGILGKDLSTSTTPVADAASRTIFGGLGGALVMAGSIISIAGINFAAAYLIPHSATPLAKDGYLPQIMVKQNKAGAPVWASIISAILAIIVGISGSFAQLAAISAISRFAQYVPTCLSVLVFRKKMVATKDSFIIPGGYFVPLFAVGVSLWLLSQSSLNNIIWGLGGLILGIPVYFFTKKSRTTQKR